MALNFAEEEAKVLDFWIRGQIFERSLEENKDKPRFTFYDGPPFATGKPHYGHLLAGTIKDVVTRFAHQTGHHVERRFGWDCHGLPVENEIDKKLEIKGPKDVEKIGIANYNDECKAIVLRYTSDWEVVVKRMGRWIDFTNGYRTMDLNFMESVWSVFQRLYKKGFVYHSVKVMPYSTGCCTPLSNFEAGQNFKEVSDPSVIVSFPVICDGKATNKHLLAWTTTPWTLPSNLALCCNADLEYVEVEEIKTGKIYICLETRLEFVFKKNYQSTHRILKKLRGSELKGLEYVPLFDYFREFKLTGAFKVLNDGYVSADSGTGIVHQAPYFGEDDFRVCLSHNIIKKDSGIEVCPIDAECRFTAPVQDYLGQFIKDADKNITKDLKLRGRLYNNSEIRHSYPFCWRTNQPLIYRAVPSWFIRVEQSRDKLLEMNAKTYWVPDYVKEKRFGNWLKNAQDWSVSRNRYWGTPIPLWISDDKQELVCVGSVEELERLSGVKVDNLHRQFIDEITIPSQQGRGHLRRVTQIFDCWFESGSMPYAQQHHLFREQQELPANFPADFIAEGIDQTRGWFYTLLVLSTLLFEEPPYKNLIVNGLVLAADGQKMSKSKKNYPDPLEVVNKYGADALRLYLITSPAVRGENLKFREEGVKDILKDVLIPWYNAYRFFMQNVRMYESEFSKSFEPMQLSQSELTNITDRWIVSTTESLVKYIAQEMGNYHLYRVVPRLVKFVDDLTNWYVRMNRQRLKGQGDSKTALSVLFHVLLTMVRFMAPFTPFISELFYGSDPAEPGRVSKQFEPTSGLRALHRSTEESVHLLTFPIVSEDLIDIVIERKVNTMQKVIELGRVIRDRKTLPLKYPLATIVVISRKENVASDVKELANYIKLELNVEELITTDDREKFGVQIKAQPDLKLLGARLRGESKAVIEAIRQMSELELQDYQSSPDTFRIAGKSLEDGELKVMYSFTSSTGDGEQRYEAHSDGEIVVLLDVLPDKSLFERGLAREFIKIIQKGRKEAQLNPADPIEVRYCIENSNSTDRDDLHRVIQDNADSINSVLKSPLTYFPGVSQVGDYDNNKFITSYDQKLHTSNLKIILLRR